MAALSGISASYIHSCSKTELVRARICPYLARIRAMGYQRRSFLSLRCRASPEASSDNNIQQRNGRMAHSAFQLLETSPGDRYTKEKSSIVVIGLNYHTAPLQIREKLFIPEGHLRETISELCLLNHIEEAAVLSTCNRMELYVVAVSQHQGVKEVTEWMSKVSGIPISEVWQHLFLLYNKDAVNHLFEVSSGLDSVVLGEGQILSQVRDVVRSAGGVAGFGRKMNGLFKRAITVGKRVRNETSISTGPVSMSSAAVDFALRKLPGSSYANVRVLVVGAGKMGKLVIKHLVSKGCKNMVVVNRTEATVNSIRKEIRGAEITYKPLSELLSCAAEAEVIFTCVASESPLLLKEQVVKLPSLKNETEGEGKRLFIDISVPRNVESCVSKLENVLLYNGDDLEGVVEATKEDRLRKANEARGIIIEEMGKFEDWKDTLETVPVIKKFRAYVERIRAVAVENFLLKEGENLTQKLKEEFIAFSIMLMNEFIHGPTKHLRCDSGKNRCPREILENSRTIERIFELDMEMSMFEEKIQVKMGRTKI